MKWLHRGNVVARIDKSRDGYYYEFVNRFGEVGIQRGYCDREDVEGVRAAIVKIWGGAKVVGEL